MRAYLNCPILPKPDTIERRTEEPRPAPRTHRIERRLTPEVLKQLVADYQAGVPTPQLTDRYNIGKGAVLRLLDTRGVLQHQNRLTAEQCAEAIQLYQQGWSLAKVGRNFGREHTVIRDVLKRAGVVRRGSHGR